MSAEPNALGRPLIGVNEKLSEASANFLIGRTITGVRNEMIFLDNGFGIYLDQEEINHINEHTDPIPEQEDDQTD